MSSILEKIQEVAVLKPNWDGYGAPALDRASIETAIRISEALQDVFEVHPPHVVPVPTGDVQFEWDREGKSLEIEIEDGDTIYFLKWLPSGMESERFPATDTDKIRELIEWFLGDD